MLELTALDFLILAVATWRASYMLVKENGPRHVFAHIRDMTRHWELFDCQYCVSIWVAAFMFIAMIGPFAPLVLVFAVSGMAVMLGNYTGADYGDVG